MITFHEAGSYKPGWWLAWDNATGDDTGQDFSAYKTFNVQLSDITEGITVTLYVQYVGYSDDYPSVKFDENGKASIQLDREKAVHFQQAYLQSDGVGTATFVDAYFENSEEDATIAIIEPTEVGELEWSNDSPAQFTLTNEAKALLVESNYVGVAFETIEYEDENERYYQTQIMGSWWTILTATQNLANTTITYNEEDNTKIDNVITSYSADATSVMFPLNATDISTLNEQGGVLICGHGLYIYAVVIGTKEAVTEYLQEWATGIGAVTVEDAAASSAVYNLAGQQVSESYKGVVVKNGKKVLQK